MEMDVCVLAHMANTDGCTCNTQMGIWCSAGLYEQWHRCLIRSNVAPWKQQLQTSTDRLPCSGGSSWPRAHSALAAASITSAFTHTYTRRYAAASFTTHMQWAHISNATGHGYACVWMGGGKCAVQAIDVCGIRTYKHRPVCSHGRMGPVLPLVEQDRRHRRRSDP